MWCGVVGANNLTPCADYLQVTLERRQLSRLAGHPETPSARLSASGGSEVGETLGKTLSQGLAARGGPERIGVATAAPRVSRIQ